VDVQSFCETLSLLPNPTTRPLIFFVRPSLLFTTTTMPVYLCQPGATANEPWRHGIHVYAAPFDLVDQEVEHTMVTMTMPEEAGATAEGDATTADAAVAATNQGGDDERPETVAAPYYIAAALVPQNRRIHNAHMAAAAAVGGSDNVHTTIAVPDATSQIMDVTGLGGNIQLSRESQTGIEIRRIRHAEVVLVDDVCVAFGRHWLRLRWPGHKGGFAGYVALGKVDEPLSKHVLEALQGTVCRTIVGMFRRI
jgi:hypothetical protein